MLFCRPRRFLARPHARSTSARLAALAPGCDPGDVRAHLDAIERGRGRRPGRAAPSRALPQSERFHWLAAPSSTIIQPSPVHTGLTDDPAAELDHLFATLVAR